MKVQEVNKNLVQFCTLKKGECFRKRTGGIYIKVSTIYVPMSSRAEPNAPQIACNALDLASGNFENIDTYEGVISCPDAVVSFEVEK